MKKRVLSLFLVIILILSVATGCSGGDGASSTMADTVIMGTIYTVDKADSTAEAIAIKDGVFSYVGDKEGVQEFIGDETEVIELEDGMAMPGFFEGHGHGHEGGVGSLFEVALYADTSIEAYAKSIEAFIKANPDIEFLSGGGWLNGYCPVGGPTKDVLDKISTEIPIVLDSGDHHSLWVNSKAMEMAGITADTPDIEGGVIERDPVTKEPTGTFRETSRVLLDGVIPDYTVEQYKEGILAYQEEAIQYGLTSYFEPMVNLSGGPNLLQAYNELDADNALKMTVFGGYQIMPDKEPLAEVDKCVKLKEEAKGGNFEMTAIKVLVDGVVEGKTAYLLEDYASDPGFKSEPLWPQDLLNQVCEKADKAGIQVHTHAIGDAATKMTLDAYAFAAEKNGTVENRHAITHLQLVAPEDIARMAELKVVASTNPYWFCKEPAYFYELEVPYLGEDRANAEYPMKSFFDAGIIVASASDYPVTMPAMPLDAIQKGITRCSLDGDQATLQNPGERVSIAQMLRSVTINGAYQNFAEDRIGSIEVGKNADVVILNQNLVKIDPSAIMNTKILKTIFQGNTVYEGK